MDGQDAIQRLITILYCMVSTHKHDTANVDLSGVWSPPTLPLMRVRHIRRSCDSSPEQFLRGLKGNDFTFEV